MDTSNDRINFLDIMVIKNDTKIETDIYYKNTNNFNYLPFDSHHPRHTKRNIPYNLMLRINCIVSNEETKIIRMNFIKNELLKLKYPPNLINDAMKKALNKKSIKSTSNNQEMEKTINFVTCYSKKSNTIDNETIKPSFQFFKSQYDDVFKNYNINNFQMFLTTLQLKLILKQNNVINIDANVVMF